MNHNKSTKWKRHLNDQTFKYCMKYSNFQMNRNEKMKSVRKEKEKELLN